MKGKFSTKTIVIIALTVLLLAIGVTGTVLFLKDSGEAAAMEEKNVLPVTGTNDEPESGAETPINQENQGENGGEQQKEETPNTTVNTNVNTTGETTSTRTTTPTQSTREITQEPETSTVEREKVIAESKELNWNKFNLTEDADNLNKNINYSNLKYRVEYYFDGELDESLTETVGKNKKDQTIETYEDKVKAGYSLERTENLPLTVSEVEENNVIKVFYAKQEFKIEKVATLYKAENNKEEVKTRSTIIEKAEKGDIIHYLVTVTNTGKVDINGIRVSDTMQSNTVLVDVNVGETKTAFEYDYEVTQDDMNAQKPIYNKATAKIDDNNVQEVERETDVAEADNSIEITKTSELVKTEGNEVAGKAQVKDKIKYAVKVKNTGNVTLEKVTINDNMLGITNQEVVVNLKPEEEKTIELGNYEVKQEDVDNQAKIYNIVTVNETEGKDEGTDVVPRNNYIVNYYKENTTEKLATSKFESAYLGSEVIETAKDLRSVGYDLVGSETQKLVIKSENNEINFYYKPRTDVSYTVKYLEKGTENELAAKEEKTGKTFNETYEETAKEITGYTVDAETKSITLDAYNKELIFYYTARTDLNYKINYYYNGNLGKSEEIKEQKYGTIIRIEDIKEKIDSNKNGYEHIETTTAQQPFVSGLIIIGTDLSKNIINVYYGRPEIKAEKTSVITTTADKGKAHVGDVIRYTIKVWNTGKISKDVTVRDSVPTGTTLNENSIVLSNGTKTVTNNKEITWNVNVPANTSKENAETITFEVKINQDAIGTKITNTAYVDETKTEDPEKYDVTKPAKITVSKSADRSGEVLTGEKVTYTLSAINEGDEAGNVVIKDASLKELINNGKLQLIGEIKTSDGKVISLEDLSKGVTITVNGKNTTKTIKYTVKITANAGEKIKNVVEVVEGGNVKEDKKEVVLEVEKNITATKLTEKKSKKNIIIAIDRSESMRYHKKYEEAKKAVQKIIDIIYPDNDTNNGTNTKVIAYAGVETCDTIGSASGYSNKEELKKKVSRSIVLGITNLKHVLKYIADEVPTTDPANNVVIFVGDGGTGWLAGVKWKDCIENSNKLKAKATVYTIGVQNSDVLRNMATDPNTTYSTVNGYTESGLTEALKKVITNISIESNKSNKKTDNGKVLLEGIYVDAKHPIVITVEGKTSETFNSIPPTIIKDGNNYYLDLTKFNANDNVSITYYSK